MPIRHSELPWSRETGLELLDRLDRAFDGDAIDQEKGPVPLLPVLPRMT